MSAELRDEQRAELLRVFRKVMPDAPTLCSRWKAHDLAFHIWALNKDPIAWPGFVWPLFALLSDIRAERIKARWSYGVLLDQIEDSSPALKCMPLDVREDYRHSLGEYFVHTEDIRRANDLPRPEYPPALQQALWRRLEKAARQLGLPRGTTLKTPDGRHEQVGEGEGPTVTGEPSELMLWAYGRHAVADVRVTR